MSNKWQPKAIQPVPIEVYQNITGHAVFTPGGTRIKRGEWFRPEELWDVWSDRLFRSLYEPVPEPKTAGTPMKSCDGGVPYSETCWRCRQRNGLSTLP